MKFISPKGEETPDICKEKTVKSTEGDDNKIYYYELFTSIIRFRFNQFLLQLRKRDKHMRISLFLLSFIPVNYSPIIS